MSASIAAGGASPYRRQTPTVWQAAGRRLWAALERVGQRRAARELHLLAERWSAFDPALAETLRAAAGTHRIRKDEA